MGFSAAARGLALFLLGVAAVAAGRDGFWATCAATLVVAAWLLVLVTRAANEARLRTMPIGDEPDADEVLPLRRVLDQLPVPLLAIDADAVHALNRAARTLFATDERVLPRPAALADPDAAHLSHEGRRYRIDRVEAVANARTLVALIDVEAEARTAEARATADMMQVLGHELLNGLAPIMSLAESGVAALAASGHDDALLAEILGTLARRAEGLVRFTEAYRTMARLPDPIRAPVALDALGDDLARLFAGRWSGDVPLVVQVQPATAVAIDRDQITQAVWSLLQNGAEAASAAAAPPRVELAMRWEAGRLVIAVADTGEGVAADEAGRIFRPFHTTKPQGTGVGLSLARQIAHAHGGEIAHRPGPPTTFVLEIPCDRVPR